MIQKLLNLLEEINGAKDGEEAKASFAKLQDRMYDYLTMVKFGDYYTLSSYSTKVDGLTLQGGLILWNTTKAK